MNHVVLIGHLSSTPQVRTLTSGSELWSLEVSTAADDGTTWSVPVAWFDPPTPPAWEVGDEVVVVGGVRRRFFQTTAGTQSRTEVVASSVTPKRASRTWRKLLRQHAERLGATSAGEVRSV
ncbi:MAG: single-stranded DNA-binding protein [Ilumatobacteraceae bacterium]